MKIPIPDDWNGESWECFQVQWPASPKYLALFAGLMSLLQRGRFWDERSGTITEAQKIGGEIFGANWPVTLCSGDNAQPPETEIMRAICGAMVVEDESMGQVVTEVRVEDGKLYVEYGPCCVYEFDICCPSGMPQPEDPNAPETPEATEWASACDKAHTLVEAIKTAVSVILNGINDFNSPVQIASNVESAIPGIDVADIEFTAAWAAGLNVAAASYDDELMNSDYWQALKCAFAPAMTGGPGGVTPDLYAELRSIQKSIGQRYFTIGDYPVFSSMQQLPYYAFASFGDKDVQKLTSYLSPVAGSDCRCPEETVNDTYEVPSGMDWIEIFDFTQSDGPFVGHEAPVTRGGSGWYFGDDTSGAGASGWRVKHAASNDTTVKYVWLEMETAQGFAPYGGYAQIGNSTQKAAEISLVTAGSGQIVWADSVVDYSIGETNEISLHFTATSLGAGYTPGYIRRVVFAGTGANPFGA